LYAIVPLIVSDNVYYQVDENDDNDEDYLVDHSIVMYLMSPTGEFLEFFTQRATIPDIVASIEANMKEKR
jgi:protein SCO1